MLFHKPAVHGIYVLCYLNREGEKNVVSASRVAEEMQVPPEQAAKVLQVLQNIGLVEAVRGRSGGYRLAKPLNDISVLEVVDALSAGDVNECLQARSCPSSPDHYCRSHAGMVAMNEQVRQLMASKSLLELAGPGCEHAQKKCGDVITMHDSTASETH
jgi:Rrf2 family protein